MAKIAFLFPGQGSQAVGMGRALYEASPEARSVIDAAAEVLADEVDLKALLFEGPEEALKLTANTQPAILTVSVAAHAALKARMPELTPAFVAGHSLGEWSALVAAGAMDLRDGVRAVRRRGQFMQEAVPEGVGAMAAVIGLKSGQVAEVCEQVAAKGGVVSPANYNSPEQTVIAGSRERVDEAVTALKEAGARRAMPLPVSAPFHCALMEPVQPRLAEVLAGIPVSAPAAPVVTNVEASPNADPARVSDLLVAQVVAPVRWTESVQRLSAEGVTHVVELGPGKVLSGLMRRIDKKIACLNVEDADGLEKTVQALQEVA